MTKKILAMLLAVALVASLAVPALAAEPTELYHCVCGAKWFASAEEETPSIKNEACANGCLKTKNLEWLPLSENLVGNEGAKSLPATGNFYLDKDINVDNTTYSKILRIDLNGHTLSRTKNRVFHVTDTNEKILVITDTSALKNGVLQSNSFQGGTTGAVVQVEAGTFSLYAGTINGAPAKEGGTAVPTDGGSVFVYSGKASLNSTFNMYGGTITGGYANNGGNIAVGAKDATCGNATFNMYGGTIQNGTATVAGGNVCVRVNATFNMYNGVIDNGGAKTGGNVHVGNTNPASKTGAGTIVMHDGVISRGTASSDAYAGGYGGGNVYVNGEGASFTMNDGVVTAGVTTAQDYHGGNICVRRGATFTMNDGEVSNGSVQNASGAKGGNIAAVFSPKITINGGTISGGAAAKEGFSVWMHQTYPADPFTVSGDPKINNIYLYNDKTAIVIGEYHLTTGAEIGIEMDTIGKFVSSGADAADMSYFVLQHNDTYITRSGEALSMTTDVGSNTAAIGFVLYPKINDALAITDRNSQSVKLVQDTNEAVTVDGDLYLDLNGKTLNGNNVTVSGGTLKVFDSKTADYDVSDGIYGKITGDVNGNIARSFVNPDNQRYLVIKTDEGYSAHRIYLAVTHSVLDSNNFSAMNYKTVFMCDEVIAKLVSDYGVTVKAEMEGSYSYFPNSSVAIDAWDGMKNNEKNTEIKNFLIAGDAENEKRAETSIQVNAYITLKDDIAGSVTSAPKTRSLKQMIEGALSIWDTQLSISQKKTLKKMYETYNTDGFMNDWAGIEKITGFDGASQNSIASVGYAAVNIDPTSAMYGKVGLMGMGNESTRLVTGVDSNAPLMAICLAVTDQDGNTVLLISVDSATVGNGVAKQIVSQISANYGVPEGNIMISSNHQHSTPVFGRFLDQENPYDAYFVNQVVEGARLALADRKEVISMNAQIVEVGENTFNFVRNVQYTDILGRPIPGAMLTDNHDDKNRGITTFGKTYESTADDDVQLVKITREGASPILLTNFQTHPHMATSSDKKTATADIIGVFRAKLAELTGCKVMYFTGASGNINAWSNIDTNKEKADLDYIVQGQSLANVVANGIQDGKWVSVVSESTGGVAVKTVTREYGVMLNTVPDWLRETSSVFENETDAEILEAIVKYAEKFWTGTYENGSWKGDYTGTASTASDLKNYGIYSKYHAKYIIMRSTNEATDTKYLTISAIAIGDLAFVVVPYEMYDTNGMWIKENSPYKMTFVTHLAGMAKDDGSMSLANGYIPSAQSYANGGYSVDIAQFAAGTGEKLAQDYIYILNELYQ